jgi:hypothetical protein
MAETAKAPETVSVRVESNPDAELFLIAGDYSLAANNVGCLTTRQLPGLYKIRAIRSGVTREEVVEISGDGLNEKFTIDDIPTIAPSPAWPQDDKRAFFDYVAELNAAPVTLKGDQGRTPSIFVFACDTVDSIASPLRGMRIYPWRRVADGRALARDRKDFVTVGNDRWAGLRIDSAAPLVLEIAVDSHVARQFVPLLPDRETHVYVRRRAFVTTTKQGSVDIDASLRSRTEWLDIALEFPNGTRKYSGVRREVNGKINDWFPVDAERRESGREAVVSALGRGRRLILNRAAIIGLLEQKFVDPYVGVAGAHLMLEAIEKRTERQEADKPLATVEVAEFPESLVDEVCKNLRRLFGYESGQEIDDPDLLAVLLRAGRSTSGKAKIMRPPLYWASWDFLLQRAASDVRVWIEPRLWRELQASTYWGAYLAWIPRRMSVESLVDSTLSIDHAVRTEAGPDSETKDAVLSMGVVREGRGPSNAPEVAITTIASYAERLAKRLRLPLSLTGDVERALGKHLK